MKQFCCILLSFLLLPGLMLPVSAVQENSADFSDSICAKSALLMEASGGNVLFEFHADDPLPPASVTKVMTILLVLEALDGGTIALTDEVAASDYASSMGGSQIYLKAGETMTVDDLLKSVVVASANDAAVALAEHVSGSEEAFVRRMNARAEELGMKNTVFKNTNGLDDSDEGHVTSARDIALMSREVLSHPLIFRYTTIWTDSIRDGAFGLTNTNRLVRFFRGCNGLKTGSTKKAGFCISAAALRDDMQLIAVVMGAPDRDARNSLAASLLDFGFSSYALASCPAPQPEPIRVLHGTKDLCSLSAPAFSAVVPKGAEHALTVRADLPDTLTAPVRAGDVIGHITYLSGETPVGTTDITAAETIGVLSFSGMFLRLFDAFLLR